MTINRRHLMMSAAAGAAAASTMSIRASHAMPTIALTQAPAYQRIRIGDVVVTALSDGHFAFGADAGLFPDVSADQMNAALRYAFLPEGTYAAPVNTYVVQSGDNTILIDAGMAPGVVPSAGQLATAMEAAGLAPSAVTHVLITHMHPDHTGLLLTNGRPTFADAELGVHGNEIGFWANEDTKSLLPESRHGIVDGAITLTEAYKDNITRLHRDGDVAPGVSAVALHGHTPGHTGYRIASGDDQLLIWGDIIHAAPVQLPQPSRAIVFDTDPEQAVDTRLKLLEEVVADRLMVAGMHMPFPGFGHIDKDGDGYRLVRADWQYNL